MDNIKINFRGKHCINCTRAIRNAISKLEGVENVELNFGENHYLLTIDKESNIKQMLKKIYDIGEKIEPDILLKPEDVDYE